MSSGQHSVRTEDGIVARALPVVLQVISLLIILISALEFMAVPQICQLQGWNLSRALIEMVYFTFHVFSYAHSELLLSILQNIFKNDPIRNLSSRSLSNFLSVYSPHHPWYYHYTSCMYTSQL